MKIYLAGPDVFLPDARALGAAKKDICARHGLVGLFPLDGGDDAPDPDVRSLAMQIFRSCTRMMAEADAIIAHLTPFRGPSADAGTVFELGWMAARGRLCAGYSNRRGDYAGRIAGAAPDGCVLRDGNGHLVEDFGLVDNLMIAHALAAFGQPVLTPDGEEPGDPFRDLTLFGRCVEWIAGHAGAP